MFLNWWWQISNNEMSHEHTEASGRRYFFWIVQWPFLRTGPSVCDATHRKWAMSLTSSGFKGHKSPFFRDTDTTMLEPDDVSNMWFIWICLMLHSHREHVVCSRTHYAILWMHIYPVVFTWQTQLAAGKRFVFFCGFTVSWLSSGSYNHYSCKILQILLQTFLFS